MKARLPNASVKTLPLYEGLGSLRYGYLPAFAQSKLPESTITPPTELPCPLRNLVVDWTTMSAPCSIGRHKRSEEHTSELQSLMRISYAVFCLKKTTRE